MFYWYDNARCFPVYPHCGKYGVQDDGNNNMTLAQKILSGDARAAARLISLLENGDPAAPPELDQLYSRTGNATIIGVTGAPGTGKSTLVDAMVSLLRSQGKTVGVIAVDPSSALSGGALLGDRIRMQRHAADSGVFIRSLATRGWYGGLSRAAIGALHILDALGMKYVIIETVGAGQVEVDITAAADTTVVVLNPGGGDAVQALKAGIMEIADVFVINKADREGTARLRTDIEAMLSMKYCPPDYWSAPVLETIALEGKGIAELLTSLERHRDWLAATGRLDEARRRRTRLELMISLEASWHDILRRLDKQPETRKLIDDILAGHVTLHQAAISLAGIAAHELGNKTGDIPPS